MGGALVMVGTLAVTVIGASTASRPVAGVTPPSGPVTTTVVPTPAASLAATLPPPAVSTPPPSGPPARAVAPVPTKVVPKPAAGPTQAANLASRLHTLPAGTAQVIVVHAPTAHTTHATLEAFAKVDGVWRPAFTAMPARIGVDGFSDHHRESVPTTPVGIYGFGATMYGINSDPGVKYAYHKLVTHDYWNELPDSARYNTFAHGADPGGASEALWETTPQYRYFAFITYNVPAVAGAGSGIFLHVGDGGPTAGCVSLPESSLVRVLRWLDPAKNPRIVMAPDSELHKF